MSGLVLRLSEVLDLKERVEKPVEHALEVSGIALPEDRVTELCAGLPRLVANEPELVRMPPIDLPEPAAKDVEFEQHDDVEQRDDVETGAVAEPRDDGNQQVQQAPTLAVLSYSPEGPVPIATRVTIAFSKPMVPLGPPRNLPADEVPAKLDPQPDGRWRWLDDATLVFEPPNRLPMATQYSVCLDGNLKSLDGSALAEPFEWRFATPAPSIVEWKADRGIEGERRPMVVLVFDQPVDVEQVLQHFDAHPENKPNAKYAMQTAGLSHLKPDSEIRRLVEGKPSRTWVAFESAEAWPRKHSICLTLRTGMQGAEGSRPALEWQAKVEAVSPFRVTSRSVHHSSIEIKLSNAVDDDSWSADAVTVEPPVKLEASVSSKRIHVEAEFQPRTKYRLTLADSIRDEYGQSLTGDRTVEFESEPSEKQLTLGLRWHDGAIVLDPFQSVLNVFSVNCEKLSVRLFNVLPDDFAAFCRWSHDRNSDRNRGDAPGSLVKSYVESVDQPEVSVKTSVSLLEPEKTSADALEVAEVENARHGHVILAVRPKPESKRYQGIESWIQITRLGIFAMRDRRRILAWVTDLMTGKPLTDVRVTSADESASTDSEGIARLPITKPAMLLAEQAGDSAFLNLGEPWMRQYVPPKQVQLLWYVVDDRGIYRPGDTVHIKGWVRSRNEAGWPELLPKAGLLRYRAAMGWRDEASIAEGSAKLDPHSGFHFSFKLPDDVETSRARVTLIPTAIGVDAYEEVHTFEVREYRRPEFEVTLNLSNKQLVMPPAVMPPAVMPPADHDLGAVGFNTVAASAEFASSVVAKLTAKYYSGGGLPDADVEWTVTSEPAEFSPPNRDDFIFGRWVPWWRTDVDRSDDEECFEGTTDASGNHSLKVSPTSLKEPSPRTLEFAAEVQDVSRQSISATDTALLHPALEYIGIRCGRLFFDARTPIKLEAIVTGIDGSMRPGRTMTFSLHRLTWSLEEYNWEESLTLVQSVTGKSLDEPREISFESVTGGEYRVIAEVHDECGRVNRSQLDVWVSGRESLGQGRVDKGKLELVPDRREYAVGDTAEILMRSPFAPAEGLLVVIHEDIERTESFRVESADHTLRVPITEYDCPNIHIKVHVVGTKPREDCPNGPPEPAFTVGELSLDVPPIRQTLCVAVMPDEDETQPGSEVEISVTVTDAENFPAVGAEVSLVVVDEAVLALTDFDWPDPVKRMFPERQSQVFSEHLRAKLIRASDGMLDATKMSYDVFGMPAAGCHMEADVLRLRVDFNPLAAFVPSIQTDEHGKAVTRVTLPDSLTRYRIMAIAASGADRFGKGQSSVTARLPLMLRPAMPRFLRLNDRCDLAVVIQNLTQQTLRAEVVLRTVGVRLAESPDKSQSGQSVEIPADNRMEVRFPALAESVGDAKIQAVVIAAKSADSVAVDFPILAPSTKETSATYGHLDGGATRHQVELPANHIPEMSGLDVALSSTAVAELTDAVLYLSEYPYECSEQLASRVLALVTLGNVLDEFNVEGLPKQAARQRLIRSDIAQLLDSQTRTGGFGFWPRSQKSDLFVSAFVTLALKTAEEQGKALPRFKRVLDEASRFLGKMDEYVKSARYSPQVTASLKAFALYVRSEVSPRGFAVEARQLWEREDKDQLPMEAAGWLFMTLARSNDKLADEVLRHIENRAHIEAATVRFTTAYHEHDHVLLASGRRADAVILEGLVRFRPKHPFIPKLVRGILDCRKRGRWYSTQENAWVLLALHRYFKMFEAKPPKFTSRVWLNGRCAMEESFEQRTTGAPSLRVLATQLHHEAAPDSDANTDANTVANTGHAANQHTEALASRVTIQHEGTGRLYYRLGLEVTSAGLAASADFGFTVSRCYLPLASNDDVKSLDNHKWSIQAGAKVLVRLTVFTKTRRHHVAISDPLAGGLEALDPTLATTSADAKIWHKDYGAWFDHFRFRDDRVEVFCSVLPEGEHTFDYVAQATGIGHFIAPPTRAEEMYHPEIFGRGSSDLLEVAADNPSDAS